MNAALDDDCLRVVLCWVMHQPQYRDLATGEALRPWVYLRGIKDCVDMAVHLESVPGACAVVVFSPLLLEQLDEYASRLAAHLRSGAPVGDPILALLTPGGVPADRGRWPALARTCLQSHPEHMIARFEPYHELARLIRELLAAGTLGDASPELLTDLAAWFHLAWLGESVREGDPRVRALLERRRHFAAAELRSLLESIADVLAGLVSRYRRLAGNGSVELALSPWGHPVLPLLFDFASARESEPGVALPDTGRYPGGADRARWHLARAVQVFHRRFGIRPAGCWPPEGALSAPAVALLQSFGFEWVASGEAVLGRSLGVAGTAVPSGHLYAANRLPGGRAACFFRDDHLSDLIGFTYQQWNGEDAAGDFVRRLERLAAASPGTGRRVVTVILEGDAAWDYFPRNGWDFLQALYERLASHPRLVLSTFSRCLREGVDARPLDGLVAGSLAGGNLSTWIGSPSRNHAWDLLCEAKRVFDQVVVEGGLSEEAQRSAEVQLGVCEGSDWFWGLDEHDRSGPVSDFDALFRRHLTNLYRVLGEPVPARLSERMAGGIAGAAGPESDSPAPSSPVESQH